jgi:tRNA threonylcarbamoyladenosine biosynthesis protein TsaE
VTLAGTGPVRITSRSPEETRAAAAALSPLLAAGDIILLGGDLGAGKTTFTQGLARGLGIDEPVTSPTFTLLHSYQSPTGLRLLHADLYRLDHLQEVVDLGLPELLEEGAAAVVEWGDLAAPALSPDYLDVRMAFGERDDERSLTMQSVGPRWSAGLRSLHQVFGSSQPAS